MIESFVDLTYHGLSLGRRVKLTQVRPTTGYLETPAPMPVGTAITVTTDEGLVLDAVVMGIHEQVGGSDRAPGMTVAPTLADDDRQAWWKARVALAEEPPPTARAKQVTVRPRSSTMVTPPPIEAITEPADEPAGGRTTVMPAIDQELLESLTRQSGAVEQLTRTTGEHAVVDDGKMTSVMDAVDPAALGLDVGGSGSMGTADDDDADDSPRSSTSLPGAVKKRKKKR